MGASLLALAKSIYYMYTGVCINRVSFERGSTGLSTDKRQNKKNCHQTK